jgi:ferritin
VSKHVLDYFGKYLMTQVRDEAIDHWDRIIDGFMKDSESQEIHNKLKKYSSEEIEFLRELLSKVVDTTLHHLLWSIEQHESIDILVSTESGTVYNVKEISDGLAGELYTEDGWINRFSNKR